MKKLIVLLFTIVLLLPDCAFARKRNYNSLCSTQPASAPVQITLSEIGYSDGYIRVVQEGYNKGEIISVSPKVFARHALKNKSKKTITSYRFKVKIYSKNKLIYHADINNDKCRIRPDKSSANTWYQVYDDSKEYHKNVRNNLTDQTVNIIYEIHSLGYSDGTSENFNS